MMALSLSAENILLWQVLHSLRLGAWSLSHGLPNENQHVLPTPDASIQTDAVIKQGKTQAEKTN